MSTDRIERTAQKCFDAIKGDITWKDNVEFLVVAIHWLEENCCSHCDKQRRSE